MKSFSVSRLSIFLLTLYALLLAVATFIEAQYGTAIARKYIYNNVAVYGLQFLMIVCFFVLIFTRKKRVGGQWGMMVLHIAFVFVLSGAFVTNLFSYEGLIHIREGEKQSVLMVRTGDKGEEIKLPFEIGLKDFRLVRYPGSNNPSSFESDLIIYSKGQERAEKVFMNKVVYEQQYRIYQTSFDKDEKGTVLTVNHDFWGMIISYTGYFLLLAGFVMIILTKNSHFRSLVRELKAITARSGVLLLLLFGGIAYVSAQQVSGNAENYAPNKESAEKFGKLLVQSTDGRIEPFNTYSSKIIRKLYKKDHIGKLDADQVLLGMLVYPHYWSEVELISQKNDELHQLMETSGSFISFNDNFDSKGTYKLEKYLEYIYYKPVEKRTRLEKDILKLDEKVNILFEILHQQMVAMFPLSEDKDHRWFASGDDLSAFSGQDSMFVAKIFPWYQEEVISSKKTGNWNTTLEVINMISVYQRARSTVELPEPSKVSTEIFYNKTDILNKLFMLYLTLGFLLMIVGVLLIIKPNAVLKKLYISGIVLVAIGFLIHTMAIALRWYISEQPPWSNAYETMVYVSWSAVLVGLIFSRRSVITLALGTMLAGFILLVAHMNFMDPEITPLVPVLKSHWLMFHVAVITSSYGFFGMSFLLGVFTVFYSCFKPRKRSKVLLDEISVINELSMTVGLYMLTIGIFLGAVWANESWGRYWGWDPKETWALITMIIYATVLHLRLLPGKQNRFLLNILSIYAFLCVLMTYFGVNYYLSGLHSYGKTDTPPAVTAIGIVYGVITIILVYACVKRHKEAKAEIKAGS